MLKNESIFLFFAGITKKPIPYLAHLNVADLIKYNSEQL